MCSPTMHKKRLFSIRHLAILSVFSAFLLLLLMNVGVSHGQIAKPVPGSVTLNFLPPGASADVNGDWVVNSHDLMAITRLLDSTSTSSMAEDINNDGLVDVRDLSIAALYIGIEVDR